MGLHERRVRLVIQLDAHRARKLENFTDEADEALADFARLLHRAGLHVIILTAGRHGGDVRELEQSVLLDKGGVKRVDTGGR